MRKTASKFRQQLSKQGDRHQVGCFSCFFQKFKPFFFFLADTRRDEYIFRYRKTGADLNYSCSFCSKTFEGDYDELFNHLSNDHASKVLNCHLCQSSFLNYGSFVSHVCFGPMQQPPLPGKSRAKFVCRMCEKSDLATFLEFQYHIRKLHNVCEICLLVSPLVLFSSVALYLCVISILTEFHP